MVKRDIYNIHNPINPETGIMEGDSIGIIEKMNYVQYH